MPAAPSLPALLPNKLEDALTAWLRAKRAGLMSGVNIAGAHEPGVMIAPCLAVFCRGARTHPDFAGVTGAYHPKLASVEFVFRVHKALDFKQTGARWAGECYALLAAGSANDDEKTAERADFAGLIADLNDGGAHHPADGLHVYEVTDAEDALNYNSTARLVSFELEMTAQACDGEAAE